MNRVVAERSIYSRGGGDMVVCSTSLRWSRLVDQAERYPKEAGDVSEACDYFRAQESLTKVSLFGHEKFWDSWDC